MAVAMNGGRRITTHEAQVKTASVEVKALTINGKQVTLSVFRQLYGEDIIDPRTTQLQGTPWGLVNYFWKGCAQWEDEDGRDTPRSADHHLHVVWQKGQELRRACVYPDGSRIPNTRPYLAHLNCRHLAGLLLAHRVLRGAERQPEAMWQDIGKTLVIDGRPVHTDIVHPVWSVFRARPGGESHGSLDKLRAYIAAHHLTQYYGSEDALEDALRSQLVIRDREDERWREQYEALAALDQLFIAV